ncbi:MAG: hypothetical protein KGI11_09730 [Thaumarchaeota archaeon]|nr:hypothetical protein [Nitrososphaerota archaeon]
MIILSCITKANSIKELQNSGHDKKRGFGKDLWRRTAQAVTQAGYPQPTKKQNRDAVDKSIVRFFYNINME